MAGKMKSKKPNALQRLLHRIVMIRPITMFIAPILHDLDSYVLKLTDGKHSIAARVAGWRIVQLTTIGAKSGKKRIMPLIATINKNQIGLIASSFGRKNNPGWYYNLKANPECHISMNGRSGTYIAREAEGDEYDKFWKMGVSVYAGYETYKMYASHRHIPVMVLEPKK